MTFCRILVEINEAERDFAAGARGIEKRRNVHMVESRCGLLCSQCTFRESMGCAGCVNITKPFWGEQCPVKHCCEERAQVHCGTCPQFPCEAPLTAFAYDPQQGDGGARLEQCRKWREEA